MNRRILILLSFSALIITLYFLFFGSSADSGPDGTRKFISSKWDPEYEILSRDPRGLGFFNELLATHVADSVYIAAQWNQIDSISGHDSATYVFIGEFYGLQSWQHRKLMHYIDSGATLLLAFDHITSNLYDTYFEDGAYMWDYSSKLHVALGDTSLAYYSVFQNDTIQADWYMFDPDQIKDTLHREFAFAMDYPIAYQSDQHKGKTLMHSIPRLFCNYQVIQPNGFAHTEMMLRRIPKNRPVIWLECARQTFEQPTANQSDEQGKGDAEQNNSYLQFILDRPSLRTAFLLGIAVFLVYVLFRAKRRENIIPGIPQPRNMSVAFLETLSSIYISRNSPYSVMLVLRKNFYAAIQRHFYIDLLTTKNRDEDIRRLIEKSSVDGDELRKMIAFLETRKPEKVNEHTLSAVYNYIRSFYQKTGITKPTEGLVAGFKEITLHYSLLYGALALLFALTTLIRGLYSLSMGSGYGILIVVLALVIFYFTFRLFTVPVARITGKELIVSHFVYGQTILNLESGVTYNTHDGVTTFYNEQGAQVAIRHILLSGTSKYALALFVEHIKLKTA